MNREPREVALDRRSIPHVGSGAGSAAAIARAVRCAVFVGREPELAALGDARRALAQSRGSVVLVGGEAGIGKSRLLRQFLDTVERDSRSRHITIAHCVERAERPFGAVRDLVDSLQNGEPAGR